MTPEQVRGDVHGRGRSRPPSPRTARASWRSGRRRPRSCRPRRRARARARRRTPSGSPAPRHRAEPVVAAVAGQPQRPAPAPSASSRQPAARAARPPRRRTRAVAGAPAHRPASSARSGSRSRSELGPIAEQRSLTAVGAVVSSDLIFQALTLILFGAIGIVLWITYRFRDFKMGVTALVALLHDVLVVVGVFAILGTFVGLQIDGLFVTAMLTIIGFSVHDTIVVFDRVRENRARHAGEPFDRIVNHSILQTFGRSITTSLTVVITLLTLLLFAGEAIGDVRAGAAARHHLRHVLVDLQREPAPRRVAPVGGPPAAPRHRGSPKPPRDHVTPGPGRGRDPDPPRDTRRAAAPRARQVAAKPPMACSGR